MSLKLSEVQVEFFILFKYLEKYYKKHLNDPQYKVLKVLSIFRVIILLSLSSWWHFLEGNLRRRNTETRKMIKESLY